MKKPKFEAKKFLKLSLYITFSIVALLGLGTLALNIYSFTNDPLALIAKHGLLKVPKKQKNYPYNERVPKSVIEAEIRKQAKQFNLDPDMMVELAKCESSLDNLAKNDKSTALGVYQYLIKTWEETESFKKERISRTDYKANIREAMIDMANGEIWRWKDCADKIGLK
jgi:hypothetical protein